MIRKLLFGTLAIFALQSCETLSNLPGTTTGGGISQAEAGEGVRQALAQGVSTAILNLNKENGFFGNNTYKLFLPPDARKIERTLRDVGLGSQVDKAILQINRAAENAVGQAKPIFVNAIKQMTIQDALNIIKGSNSAATDYFREKTRAQLVQAFSPTIKESLDNLQATRYYGDVINLYNRLPTTSSKINPDLTSYVVEKATDALFDQIAVEEQNIRENPVARTTEILKKVFGAYAG